MILMGSTWYDGNGDIFSLRSVMYEPSDFYSLVNVIPTALRLLLTPFNRFDRALGIFGKLLAFLLIPQYGANSVS